LPIQLLEDSWCECVALRAVLEAELGELLVSLFEEFKEDVADSVCVYVEMASYAAANRSC